MTISNMQKGIKFLVACNFRKLNYYGMSPIVSHFLRLTKTVLSHFLLDHHPAPQLKIAFKEQ